MYYLIKRFIGANVYICASDASLLLEQRRVLLLLASGVSSSRRQQDKEADNKYLFQKISQKSQLNFTL